MKYKIALMMVFALSSSASAQVQKTAERAAMNRLKGQQSATVTVYEIADFQCPYCARVEPAVRKILEEYPGKVRLVWRDFPLPFHQEATPAAIVARVAGEQGKFWEMHDKLYENQRTLDRASLERYAQEVGVNVAKVKAALK